MRRRRVIIFDDEVSILTLLTRFFTEKGYDVLNYTEPTICPVYTDDLENCGNLLPCADIMITDMKMPGMTGLDILKKQKARQCRLDIRNKALMSGMLSEKEEEEAALLGIRYIKKPFKLSELVPWILDCETRMDLSRPLALKRQDRRVPCAEEVTVIQAEGAKRRAVAINTSPSGVCLKMEGALISDQIVFLGAGGSPLQRKASVRWTMEVEKGSCQAGLSYC